MSCEFCSNVVNKAGYLESTVSFSKEKEGVKIKCLLGCTSNPTTLKSATNFKNSGGQLSIICHKNPFRYIYNRECNPKPSRRR